jgi:hypothetical protein
VAAFAERLVDLLGDPQKREKTAAGLEAIPRVFSARRIASDQIAFFRARVCLVQNKWAVSRRRE